MILYCQFKNRHTIIHSFPTHLFSSLISTVIIIDRCSVGLVRATHGLPNFNCVVGFYILQFKQKASVFNKHGKPILTAIDSSNPWWALLEEAVGKANGKLGKPEIFPAATDSRYFRLVGLPAIGFSPMANTPILLHDHNEVP